VVLVWSAIIWQRFFLGAVGIIFCASSLLSGIVIAVLLPVTEIMECISSVSFFILVNGDMTKQFKPSQGLRQGDPLSPYLFIICQEVLSRPIDREFLYGNVKGVKMNVAGLAFTHVMYADDIMVFAKANCREVKILDECLDKYCAWSGQLINGSKSRLIFSKLVCCAKRRELKALLAVKKIHPNVKYFGSLLFSSSSRIKDFKFL
jgi:hypothetical protein